METARIKAARARLWRAWMFGGLLWSVFLLGLAWFVTWLIGAEQVQIVQFAVVMALTLCMGLYAIFYLGSVLTLIVKRLLRREPIMDRE